MDSGFTITVRSLGGRPKYVDVGPETAISQLRIELSEGLPAFHLLLLFVGATELVDGGTVASTGLRPGLEVQAVATLSADLAMQVFADCTESTFRCPYPRKPEYLPALEVLSQLGDLAPSYSKTLLSLTSVGVWWFDGAVQIALGKTLGRVCSDLEENIPELMLRIQMDIDYRIRTCAILALAEISLRHKSALAGHSADLVRLATLMIAAACDPMGPASWFERLECKSAGLQAACQLLGQFGDSSHVQILNMLAEWVCTCKHFQAAHLEVGEVGHAAAAAAASLCNDTLS